MGHNKRAKEFRLNKVAECFSKLIEDESKILDIGCGDCYLGYALSKHKNLKYQGIDVKLRKENYPFKVNIFDGKKLPFKSKSFDYCMFVDTIHHIKYPDKILREAMRVAKKCIIIKDSSYYTLRQLICLWIIDLQSNIPKGIKCPLNFYSFEMWFDLFDRLGFSIDYANLDYEIKHIDLAHHVIFKLKRR